jgi:transposase
MNDNRDLYEKLLGLEAPWKVSRVELDPSAREVRVHVSYAGSRLPCPTCGKSGTRDSTRVRRWQHLNTCEFRTFLIAEIPRVQCREHGKLQMPVPWAEPNSRFTYSFERFAIDVLLATTISDAARLTGLSWNQLSRIQGQAVSRGLARRKAKPASILGVDETSFRKGHKYLTIVSDLTFDHVLHVEVDRNEDSLNRYYETLTPEQCEAIDAVALDMWAPYISSTMKFVPHAEVKIAFDKFHVAKHLGDAVNDVRKAEHRALMADDDDRLKGSRFWWNTNSINLSRENWQSFEKLRTSALKTARAWTFKEAAMGLWHYLSRTWATKQWNQWIQWAKRSRLEPIKRVARTIEAHLTGIVNAVVLGVTSAGAEGMNSKIQKLKSNANGYRNQERFKQAIYFHFGGLDLYPGTLS